MVDLVLACVIIITGFFVSFFLLKGWISSTTLFGRDQNKYDRPLVAEAGGVAVSLGICFALCLYVFVKTFLWHSQTHLIAAFTIILTLLLAGFIGFIDDILGWKQGIKQSTKVLLTIPITLPLICINAGHSFMNLPFVGLVDFGWLYPLMIVPIAVIGSTNGFNMLAGYNGLEAGMGLIIFATFGLVGLFVESYWIALISFITAACLLAFLCFNWFPSSVFPGNSLTYPIGALIGTIAVLGNMEKLALWLFTLYFIEGILYFRCRVFDKIKDIEAFAKVNNDGSLAMPYQKIYDTTHFAIWLLKKIRHKVYERDVVVFLLSIQFLIAFFGIVSYL